MNGITEVLFFGLAANGGGESYLEVGVQATAPSHQL